MLAASNGRRHAVTMLCQVAADTEVHDARGRTAQQHALDNGCWQIVEYQGGRM